MAYQKDQHNMTSDLQKQKLRGKVKSIKDFWWKKILTDKDGNIVGDEMEDYGFLLKKFNKSGNLLEEIRYDTTMYPSSTKKYKYDNKGNLIEINLDTLKFIESYKYDYAGRVIEANEKSYDGRTLKVTKYQYNNDSSISSIHHHNVYENYLSEEFSEYDERGNKIFYKSYYNNILDYKAIRSYDINNHITKKIVFRIDKRHKSFFGLLAFPFVYERIPSSATIYKHDDKGNVTEDISIRRIWTIVDYFIPLNISQLFISFFTKKEYEYDDEGKLTKEVWLNLYKYGSLDTFFKTYTYDSAGNWIQRISFGESNTMTRDGRRMQERIIEYY